MVVELGADLLPDAHVDTTARVQEYVALYGQRFDMNSLGFVAMRLELPSCSPAASAVETTSATGQDSTSSATGQEAGVTSEKEVGEIAQKYKVELETLLEKTDYEGAAALRKKTLEQAAEQKLDCAALRHAMRQAAEDPLARVKHRTS
jgi:hypothetical protein